MNSWFLALSKTIIWISIFVFENPDPVLEIITNLLLRLKDWWFGFRLCLLNLVGFSFICWALASRILRFFSSNAILIRLAASYRLKVGYFFRLSSFHWSMDSLLHGSTPLKEDGRVFILKKITKFKSKSIIQIWLLPESGIYVDFSFVFTHILKFLQTLKKTTRMIRTYDWKTQFDSES